MMAIYTMDLNIPLQVGRGGGGKYQLMTKSCLQEVTKPTVLVPEVAKQLDMFAHVTTRECSP